MNIYRKKHENFTQKEKKRLSQSILLYLTVLKALKYPHLSMCVCVWYHWLPQRLCILKANCIRLALSSKNSFRS